jgi:hypothetical protein
LGERRRRADEEEEKEKFDERLKRGSDSLFTG